MTIATLLTTTIVLEIAELRTDWHPSWARLLWKLGDYTLYATFFAFGIAQFTAGRLSVWAQHATRVMAAVMGIGWAITSPTTDGVVNNSPSCIFFIGTAWLALASPRVRRSSRSPSGPPSTPSYAVSVDAASRSSLALGGRYHPLGTCWSSFTVAAGPAFAEHRRRHDLITAAAVTILGRLEDRAAGRVSNSRDGAGTLG